jgi:hypothetical protein
MDWVELPPVQSTPCTEWPLRLSRDGYVDQFDEWRPGTTWSGEKYVLDSVDPDLRVRLKVTVFGKGKGPGVLSTRGRIRPHSWTATLVIEGFGLKAGSGRCRTLVEAVRAVEGIDLPPLLRELLRAFYGPEGAACVYSVEDGELKPWATRFGKWGSYKGWPMMREFLVVRRVEGVRKSSVVKTGVCGYSESTDERSRRLGGEVELWTNWIGKLGGT